MREKLEKFIDFLEDADEREWNFVAFILIFGMNALAIFMTIAIYLYL